MFLKFVWGRSSLPSLSSHFTQKFIIQRHHRDQNPDSFLPESHTCYFTLDLPEYSTYDIMREKLMYAIHNCKQIDTDFDVNESEEVDAQEY